MRVREHFTAVGIDSRELAVSHAFHSTLMDPMLAEFQRFAETIQFSEPHIPIVSNLTGAAATAGQLTDPRYWVEHIRQPVRFADGIAALETLDCRIHVEIGPHPTLIGMGQMVLASPDHQWIPSLVRTVGDDRQLREGMAALFTAGVDLDWHAVGGGSPRHRVALPTYPFRRERHWIDCAPSVGSTRADRSPTNRTGHPLLAGRVDTPMETKICAVELGAGRPSFLQDHVISGRAVYPATAFVEVIAAAAHELRRLPVVEISSLQIHQALILTDDGTAAQAVLAPEGDGGSRLRVYSRPATGVSPDREWILHAEAIVRFGDDQPHSPQRLDLDNIRARLAEHRSGEEYYRRLADDGFAYGVTFRGIQAIARRDGEVLASVEAPSEVDVELSRYRAHPALLDACLQSTFAALPSSWQTEQSDEIYLPVALSTVRWYGALSPRLHAHVQLRQTPDRPPARCTCDVTIVNADSGAALVRVAGIELRRVRSNAVERSASDISQHLYDVRWHEGKLATDEGGGSSVLSSIDPVALAAHADALIPSLREVHAMHTLDVLAPELDALSCAYAAAAVRSLGWSLERGSRISVSRAVEELNVVAPHRRMLDRVLEMLSDDGCLRLVGSDWLVERTPVYADPAASLQRLVAEFPQWRDLLTLLHKCGSHLAAVLSGRTDPLQLLFSGGSLEEIEALYTKSPFTAAYNGVVRGTITRALEGMPADRPLRVLEIGAGTGGTTRHVLPALPRERVRYLYTDMSVLFLGEARDRFHEFPFVEYRLLDIGKDAAEQGFAIHQADLVIASNVLHATPDLAATVRNVRSLLAPGGLLLLVEGISKQRWVDMIFGLTEGWWNSTDAELRAGYPLISQAAWRNVLTDAGFTHALSVPGDGRETELFQQAVIIARAAADPAALIRHDARKWLLLADRGGFTDRLAEQLRDAGADCHIVRTPRPDTGRDDDDRFLAPWSREDIGRMLDEVAASDRLEIVSAWGLDASPDMHASAGVLEEVERQLVTASLNLVQAAVRSERSRPPRLWWLSRGAQSVHRDPARSLAQVPVLGLAKTIAVEHPELRTRRIDLDPWADLTEVNRVVAEFLRPDDEDEVAYRRGERLVPRLERIAGEPPSAPFPRCDGPGVNYRLTVDPAKGLDSLRYETAKRIAPAPGQIEISVRASGLNFKDVLGALGLYPGDPGPLGGETSGVVTAIGSDVTELSVGDEVMAFCPGAFAAFVTVDASLAVVKPARLSFEQAATIPGAFLTAYYAVVRVAQLRPGERILVHAGAGGVGMAAIAIARAIGAHVYATAGSPEKRAWLTSLGVLHAMDSRSAASLAELQPLTQGAGVDVVINSLSGDFVRRSLELLADGGRFVELGKRDLLDEAQIAALAPRVAYRAVDIAEMARRDPGTIAPMLRQLQTDFVNGRLEPLPLRVFPIEETAAAFDFMARARHVGKICISLAAGTAHRARSIPDTIRADASYLITGGFGGLGIETAGWLVRRGARHIALMGRGAPTAAASTAIADLQTQGAQILVVFGDVANASDVLRVFREIEQAFPPLRGVVHSAGTLADAVVLQQDWEHFRHVFAAKVFGAWNLHRATASLDLDFFVLYSSVAAVLGTAGQANHVAANAFLDALAHSRRATGLPAISINWGEWGSIGAVANSDLARRLSLRGLMTITPAEGVSLLETALDRDQPQIAAVALDWVTYLKQFHPRPPRFFDRVTPATPRATAAAVPGKTADVAARLITLPPARRKAELLRFVAEQIAAGLEIENAKAIDPAQPLSDLGVDSLLAVELRHRLSAALGVERSLPATLLFDYPTIDALAGYIGNKILNVTVAAGAAPAVAGAADVNLIAALSDAEAEAMLLSELDVDINE